MPPRPGLFYLIFKRFVVILNLCVHAHVWAYEHESRLMGRPEVLKPLELGSIWLLDTWYGCWELKSGSLQVEYTLLTLSHLSSPISSCMCVHVSVYVCVHRKGRPERV